MVTFCVGTAVWNVTEGKIEGRVEVTRRRGTGRDHLLGDFKKKIIGYRKLQERALDRTL